MKKIKTQLSDDDIKYLAILSRLSLKTDEIGNLKSKLSETIEYINNLQKLNTENILPTASVVNMKNVVFQDGVPNKRRLKSSEALKNAKNKTEKFFVIKKRVI